MVIYSDPPREKKAAPQPSEYEQAVERLGKLKLEGSALIWSLSTCSVDGAIAYRAHIGWGITTASRSVRANGRSAMDAACACIDQWRTAMALEEEEGQRLRTTIAKARADGALSVEFGEPDREMPAYSYCAIDRTEEQVRFFAPGPFPNPERDWRCDCCGNTGLRLRTINDAQAKNLFGVIGNVSREICGECYLLILKGATRDVRFWPREIEKARERKQRGCTDQLQINPNSLRAVKLLQNVGIPPVAGNIKRTGMESLGGTITVMPTT